MWIVGRLLVLLLGLFLVNLQLTNLQSEVSEPIAFSLQRAAPALAFLGVLVFVIAVGMRNRWRARFVAILGLGETAAPAPESSGRWWNGIGWVALVGGFVGLEWRQPYYFTQDDVLIGELPAVLLGCRSLWAGVFPDWNPYVFLGAPFACLGLSSLTYPPQLFAYAIARHILGDEFATMEVFAAMHLLVGFMAMRHLSLRIGMGAMPANLAALSFVFAGCILLMGRSWHAFVPYAAWLPLVGIGIQRFRDGPVGWKWIVGIGLVLGLSYHAGFPQITAIVGMFLVLGIASASLGGGIPLRRVAALVPAVLLGVGLAAPLLLHQPQWVGGLSRDPPLDQGIYDELAGALLPYPLVQANLPLHWGSTHFEKMGHFYFFGGLFAFLFALHATAFWLLFPRRSAWGRAWWVPCGVVALVLTLGEPAFLWRGLSFLPLAKLLLRYSFRFYPLLALCAILSGGLILERFLAILQRRRPWEWTLGALMLGVLGYHLAMCQASFYTYSFLPIPPLPAEFAAVFHPYADPTFVGVTNSKRIASWTQQRSPAPDHYLALPLNLPMFYQTPSILGYDPVVEGQPRMGGVIGQLERNPVETCKAFGVGWHLIGTGDAPVLSPNEQMSKLEHTIVFEPAFRGLLNADLTPLADVRGTILKELPGVDPLAFETGRPDRPLPMHLHCRGVDVDVKGLPPGARVTINFLAYPQMNLSVDGQPVVLDADDWQRITTTLPSAGSTLSLRFDPPWVKTCAAGAALCLAALLLAWLILRQTNR